MNDRRLLFQETALRLILEKGFKGMTMRDLANALQCDVANIYNYTPSKQAFLKEELLGMSAKFHTGIDEILTSGLNTTEQIKHLVHLYLQLSRDFPLQMALLANEWRNLESSDLEKFIKERKDYEEKVKKMLMKGMRKGEIRKMNPDTITHLLLSALRWLFSFGAEEKVVNRVRLEEEILEFVTKGLDPAKS